MTSILLPATVPLDEKRAINRVAIWVALAHHQLSKQWSREWLETTLRRYLRDGLIEAATVVEAADEGDEIADAALRQVFAELQEVYPAQRQPAPGRLQILAYGQRAILRPPNRRKRGRHQYDDWVRNMTICTLIVLACGEFGVNPTRSRESRRARRNPSGISLVAGALARNRIFMDEKSIQGNIWHGLPGKLTRKLIADQMIDRGLLSVP